MSSKLKPEIATAVVGSAWFAWPCQVELCRRQPRGCQIGARLLDKVRSEQAVRARLLDGGNAAAVHRAVLARPHVQRRAGIGGSPLAAALQCLEAGWLACGPLARGAGLLCCLIEHPAAVRGVE
eukprot:scaffold106429_cov64-Phaeocystis_antarctica.AAC.2